MSVDLRNRTAGETADSTASCCCCFRVWRPHRRAVHEAVVRQSRRCHGFPRGVFSRRNDCQCLGGENERPRPKGRPMEGRLARTRWMEECVHRTYCTCVRYMCESAHRPMRLSRSASAFLKTLWERVGLWRNAVRAKTAAKKTAPNSKRLPNGAHAPRIG